MSEKIIREVIDTFAPLVPLQSFEDLRDVMSEDEWGKLARIEWGIRFVSRWRHPYTLSVEFQKDVYINYTIPISSPVVVTAISSDLKKSLIRIVRKHGASIIADWVPAEALEKWKWAYVIEGDGDQLCCQVIYKDGEIGGRLDFQVYVNGVSG